MKLINGKSIAQNLREELGRKIKKFGIKPGLAAILVGDDPASRLYVKLKEKACAEVGVDFKKYLFPAVPAKKIQKQVLDLINALNQKNNIHGILVQLPLPRGFDTNKIIAAIDPQKDVDGFHPKNRKALKENEPAVLPPTAQAILTLLKATQIGLKNKTAALLIKNKIFGESIKYLLKKESVRPKIVQAEKQPQRRTDIVITALGRPNFIKGEMIKKNAIVIDVGVTPTPTGVCGDVDADSAKNKVAWLSPVPGGVGPLTVAYLLKNTLELALKQQKNSTPPPATSRKMRGWALRAGNFQIQDAAGKTFDCFKYQGDDYLLLLFYRGYWCHLCREQFSEINNNFEKFKKLKIKIAGVSPDKPLYASLLSNYLKIKFPLLPDFESKIKKIFNLPEADSKKIKSRLERDKPAIFLFSPEHKIIYSYLGKTRKDRPTIQKLIKDCRTAIAKT